MLPAVSDLLKSGFDESLKKLVLPVGLVPAAVLTTAGLLFLYPVLLEHGNGPAVVFSKLDGLWQALSVTAFVLLLGYILQVLTPTISRAFAGEALTAATGPSAWLVDRQQAALDHLSERIKGAGIQKDRLRWERLRRFPADDDGQASPLAATAMGNAWLAASWAPWRRYRIDLTALWLQMRAVLANEDEPLLKAIDDEKASIDTLSNLAFAAILFAVAGLALHLGYGDGSFTLSALLAVAAAYGLYRAALARVFIWRDLVDGAFDLHRDDLLKALGHEPPTTPSDERRVWEHISSGIGWNTPEADAEDKKSGLTVEAPPGLGVSHLKPIAEHTLVADEPLRVVHDWTRDYWVSVRRTGGAHEPRGTFFISVTDPDGHRLLRAPRNVAPLPPGVRVRAFLREANRDGAQQIVWAMQNVRAGAAFILRYRTPQRFEVELAPLVGDAAMYVDATLEAGAPPRTYVVKVTRSAATPGHLLRLRDDRLGTATVLVARWDDGSKHRAAAVDGSYRFPVPSTLTGGSVRIFEEPTDG